MNFKEELEFQRDQFVAMFDGIGQFVFELLVLGAVGIMMVAGIFSVLGFLTAAIK